MVHFRKIPRVTNSKPALVTTYLQSTLSNNMDEREILWQLFQFITFLQTLPNLKVIELSGQRYYEINFQVPQFLDFIGVSNNHYQLKKLKVFLEILRDLQKNQPIMYQISDQEFRSVNEKYKIF
jgi:hypothetical protein